MSGCLVSPSGSEAGKAVPLLHVLAGQEVRGDVDRRRGESVLLQKRGWKARPASGLREFS